MRHEWDKMSGLLWWLFLVLSLGVTLWALAIVAAITAIRWVLGGS